MDSFKNLVGWAFPGKAEKETEELLQTEDKENGQNGTCERETVTTDGDITVYDEDMNIGIIDGRYRFDILKFNHLRLRQSFPVTYTVARAKDRDGLDWEVVDIRVRQQQGTVNNSQAGENVPAAANIEELAESVIEIIVQSEPEVLKELPANVNAPMISKPTPKKNTSFSRVICKVAYCEPDSIYVYQYKKTEKLRVNRGLFGPSDFVLVGDWLALFIENADDPVNMKVVSVQWAEKGTVIGKIMLRGGFHCVGGAFVPPNELTKRGMNLKVGDYCKVTYILSDQCKLRPEGQNKTFFNKRSCRVETVTEKEIRNFEEDASSAKDGREIEQLLKNKNRIVIEPAEVIPLGSFKINSCVKKPIQIANNNNDLTIGLKGIRLQGDQSVCEFSFELQNPEGGGFLLTIGPMSTVDIMLVAVPKLLGKTQEICVFDFGTFLIGRKITLRALTDQTHEDLENAPPAEASMAGLSRQSKKSRGQKKRDEERRLAKMLEEKKATLVPGPAAVRTPFFLPSFLPAYTVPPELEQIYIAEHSFEGKGAYLLRKAYPEVDWTDLTFQNYLKRFHMCLWLEELETVKIRKDLDLTNVLVFVENDLLYLDVPYLSESKPILNVGERVRCYYSSLTEDPDEAGFFNNDDDSDSECEDVSKRHVVHDGYIHSIKGQRVFAKFEKLHLSYNGSPVNVTFKQRRTNYKRQHHALELAVQYLEENFLFPLEGILDIKLPRISFVESMSDDNEQAVPSKQVEAFMHVKAEEPTRRLQSLPDRQMVDFRASNIYHVSPSEPPRAPGCVAPTEFIKGATLNWFNSGLNPEQKDAVRRILRGQCRPLPYIIFGPPGTGKTVTVVEAVMQINKLDPESRILVAVPSNQAADLIAERLVMSEEYGPGDFIRLNGFMRSGQPVPESISKFCMNGENLHSVVRHKIIISTISTAGQFYQLSLAPNHFTHVFIDEAGYATEPETLVACVLASISKEGQIILSGDPNQLLPVLYHKSEVHKILRRSLLERFMGTSVYKSQDPEKFQENFNPVYITMLTRSYRLPEALLDLPSKRFYNGNLISKAPTDYELLGKLDFIREKTTPLIFQGIIGRSQHKGSPSWCNQEEIQQCITYVKQLRQAGVESKDIGIISLYRKQVDVLKSVLGRIYKTEQEMPKVATIQEFQGGERKVIIITTVLSMHTDILKNLSSSSVFILSSKMFNVAITRAKSLLIIVGDPHTLQYSNDWLDMIRYCVDLGVYFGCQLPSIIKPLSCATAAEIGVQNNDDLLGSDGDDSSSHAPSSSVDNNKSEAQANGSMPSSPDAKSSGVTNSDNITNVSSDTSAEPVAKPSYWEACAGDDSDSDDEEGFGGDAAGISHFR